MTPTGIAMVGDAAGIIAGALDHVTHSWDLARAAGLPIVIDDDTAGAALATMQVAVSAEFRAAGFYGPEQTAPEDAATMDRLAAFTGGPL